MALRHVTANEGEELSDEKHDGMMSEAYVEHEGDTEDDGQGIYEAFRALDRDGNSYISAAEILWHVTAKEGEDLTREEVVEMMRDADVNNDGLINFEEYAEAMFNEESEEFDETTEYEEEVGDEICGADYDGSSGTTDETASV